MNWTSGWKPDSLEAVAGWTAKSGPFRTIFAPPFPLAGRPIGINLAIDMNGSSPRFDRMDRRPLVEARLVFLLLATAVWLPGTGLLTADPEAPRVTAGEIREAADRAGPWIERSSAMSLRQRACFTCHHGSFPAAALLEAWSHGLDVRTENLTAQLQRARDRLQANLARLDTNPEDQGDINGEADATGQSLWMLHLAGYAPDTLTARTVQIHLADQEKSDHWEPALDRPPTVGSPFTTTYLVLRGFRHFGTAGQARAIARRQARALEWLHRTPPRETEDAVFRLRSLHLLEPDGSTTQEQARALVKSQQEDGGWAQIADGRSDAYATGTVLAALADTGSLDPGHPVYQRGLRYLLDTRDRHGTWHVRKRTGSVQPFYQSGFPHDRDQFISICGTSWAVYALLKALPPAQGASKQSFVASHPDALPAMAGGNTPAPLTEQDIAFFRDKIEPVLQDKCYRCHSADAKKLKAGLRLDTRLGIRSGGENGPALLPGHAEDSLLLRSLLGRDDLSLMPPKEALPPETIEAFRQWIAQGAPDPREP